MAEAAAGKLDAVCGREKACGIHTPWPMPGGAKGLASAGAAEQAQRIWAMPQGPQSWVISRQVAKLYPKTHTAGARCLWKVFFLYVHV